MILGLGGCGQSLLSKICSSWCTTSNWHFLRFWGLFVHRLLLLKRRGYCIKQHNIIQLQWWRRTMTMMVSMSYTYTHPPLPGGSGNNAPTPNALMPVIGIHHNFPASEHVNVILPLPRKLEMWRLIAGSSSLTPNSMMTNDRTSKHPVLSDSTANMPPSQAASAQSWMWK